FHYRAFTAMDVEMTRNALMAYSFALLGWSAVKVLAPGYFARHDTRTPMRAALISLGLTIALNIGFVVVAWYLDLLDRPGVHVVLAATNGAGALLNAALLFRGLYRERVLRPAAGWPLLWARI